MSARMLLRPRLLRWQNKHHSIATDIRQRRRNADYYAHTSSSFARRPHAITDARLRHVGSAGMAQAFTPPIIFCIS